VITKARAVVAFDFDQTLADTSSLAELRDKRDWERCRSLAPTISFYSGLESALRCLQEAGLILCLVSTSPRKYLDAFLPRSGAVFDRVLGYRKPIVHIDDLSYRAKIKRDQLAELAERYPAAQMIFVGDDENDYAAARAKNATFLHACWSARTCKFGEIHVGTLDKLCGTILGILNV
jgi:phosphoglycolate phosphatase-like HAD superfamily hydrolase